MVAVLDAILLICIVGVIDPPEIAIKNFPKCSLVSQFLVGSTIRDVPVELVAVKEAVAVLAIVKVVLVSTLKIV